MITATCHCGAASIEVVRAPRRLTDCNCSICRRYGAPWAYYPEKRVRRLYRARDVERYLWGDRMLRFVRCKSCGTILHHERTKRRPDSMVGVNARNFEPQVIARARIRHLDGARTWKFLDWQSGEWPDLPVCMLDRSSGQAAQGLTPLPAVKQQKMT